VTALGIDEDGAVRCVVGIPYRRRDLSARFGFGKPGVVRARPEARRSSRMSACRFPIGSGQPAWQVLDRLRTVGPGWHPLLLRLHEQIVTIDPGYRIDDLKEKLGAVRVRISGDAVPSEIRGLSFQLRFSPRRSASSAGSLDAAGGEGTPNSDGSKRCVTAATPRGRITPS
jgi:hypothetical protein